MKKKPAATPAIGYEDIGPKQARQYLQKNVSNRTVRKGTVTAYARDMSAGNWVPTHQGIAFNDRGELIDGQHRLHAIIESGVTVRIMVTRGVPSEVGAMRTMDAVDRGAVRSVADQLQLQHGYRNAPQVAGCGSVIAQLGLRKWLGRITVPQMLKILEVYGRHIEPVIQTMNNSKVKVFRRGYVTGPLAFARVVAPQRIDDFCASLESGASLAADSPVLLLRNHLLAQGALSTNDARLVVKLVLNCAHRFVINEPMLRVNWKSDGLRYFADRQKENLAKVADVMQTSVSTFDEKEESPRSQPTSDTPAAPPISATSFKLTPLAESLLRGKEMSERISRKVAARG